MNSLFVVKYGGAAMNSMDAAERLVIELVMRHKEGARVVLVHGGGGDIDKLLALQGIEPRKVNGLRVTDTPTMEAAQMVLAGKINKNLAAFAAKHGGKALGLCGIDGGLLQCRRKASPGGGDLGLVGEVSEVNTQLLYSLLYSGYLPIVASIGIGADGQVYNVNADEAASAIAVALKAETLLILTDVPGILRRYPDESTIIPELTLADARRLLAEGILNKGMIPKLQACIQAVEGGAGSARVVDGRSPEKVGLTLARQAESGTRIGGSAT